MGFLENFKRVGKTTLQDKFFILEDKVCPYRTYTQEEESQAYERGVPPLNFVVFHTQEEFDDLRDTLSSIFLAEFFPKKGRIIIVYNTRNRKEILDAVAQFDQSKVSFVSILDDDARWLDEAFLVVKNGYFVLVNEGFKVPENIFEKLNVALNEKMMKVVSIRGVDTMGNLRTVMCAFAKFLRLDHIAPIEPKIELLRQEQNIEAQMVFTWDEIDAAYCI